jgi:DNA-binding SARP family transcriptional activator/tetratricopeptide (TPR) repeat protein
VLGGLGVEGLEQSAHGSRKQRRLLARLAVARGAVVSQDELTEDLWGDAQPANPRDQLAVLVSRLRSALSGAAVIRRGAGYALVVDWSDIDALADRRREAERRAAEHQWAAAAEAARSALALLRGPVLPELAEASWVSAVQESVDRSVSQVRLVLARAELAVGNPRLAADVALEALTASPYDEVALRLHLEACLAAHSPALGLATYASVRRRLAEELGIDPAPETLAAYERLLQATGPREPAGVVGATPPGRARELAIAQKAIEAAARGSSRLIVFTGELGIGKTRVLQSVAELTPHLVVWAHCDELGRVLPLQPVLDALAEVLRVRTPDEIAGLLGDDAALLGPLVGLGLPTRGAGLPDGGTGQVLLQAAVVRLLDRLAGAGAVVLLVDDAHLADPATLALLAGLPRRATRVAAVLAARAGEGPAWPGGTVVELGPLDLEAVTELVGRERAAVLHERSGGHPLLLHELAAHEGDALPLGLRAAFAAAADSAGRAGITLRAASVVGPDLDLDVLAQVLDRPAVELLDDLEEGVRRRLLIEHTSGFAFRHSLVREALAAGVGQTRQSFLHRETARALHARGGADPLVLAHHARAGGAPELAADAFAVAAQIAANRHAHEAALQLSEEALASAAGHPAAALLRARALLVLGRHAEAGDAAEAAYRAGAGPAARQVSGLAAHYRRDWILAAAFADRAAEEADDPDLRATSLAVGAHALHAAGDVHGAEQRFAAAGEAVSGLGRAPSGWLALLRHHQGRSEETLALTQPDGPDPTGLDQLALPLVRMSRGLACAALGRSAEALACFDSMQEVTERLDLFRYAGRADNCRGYVLRNLGQLEWADDLNVAARAAGAEIDLAEPQAHAVLDLAEGRLRARDLDAVALLLAEAAPFGGEDHPHAFRWRHRVRAGWLQGRLHLALGETDEAGACAEAVVREAEARGIARYTAFGAVLTLHVRITQGEPMGLDEALRVVDSLDSTAAMEQLWLVSQLEQAAGGRLRTALHARAEAAAERLVAASPAALTGSLTSYASRLLD